MGADTLARQSRPLTSKTGLTPVIFRRTTKKPDAHAEALAIVEHTLIYRLISKRKGKKPAKHISLDELLKEQKIAG